MIRRIVRHGVLILSASCCVLQAEGNPNFKFHYTIDKAHQGWMHSEGFVTKEVCTIRSDALC